MRKFLLGDFYGGDKVTLADGRSAVVVRLEDREHLRVKTPDGRETVVEVRDILARQGEPPC